MPSSVLCYDRLLEFSHVPTHLNSEIESRGKAVSLRSFAGSRESHAGIDRAKSFAAQRHARAVVSRAFSCLLTTHIDVIGFRVPRSFPK